MLILVWDGLLGVRLLGFRVGCVWQSMVQIGCTNNNYASREKCKKCGQPKEVVAMPAIAMHGASLPTYPHYFSRAPGGLEQKMNIGLLGNGAFQHSVPLALNLSLGLGGANKYGNQSSSGWPFGGNQGSGLPYADSTNQPPMVSKGWRNGDWICNCGFHNYSSRAQCKKCNASVPPALGTKRLASEDFVQDWDNKRLNAGQTNSHFPTGGLQQLYPGYEHMSIPAHDPKTGLYAPYPVGSSGVSANLQMHIPLSQPAATPALLGKGAKQWREGDWMCTKCDNHNYASRAQCNKCKTDREAQGQSVSIM